MSSMRSRVISMVGAFALCAFSSGSANATGSGTPPADPLPSTAPIVINGTTYVRTGAAETDIMAPFGAAEFAVSTESFEAYSGYVEVVVSGTGQSAGSAFNDAFYVNIPGSPSSDPLYYQLAIDSGPLEGSRAMPMLAEQHARNLVVYDSVIGAQKSPPYAPAYRTDGTYRFVIDLTRTASWSGIPSTLQFGVADGGYDDNTGFYAIDLYQLAPAQTGEAVLLQAVPGDGYTRVAVSVSGGIPDGTASVEIVASNSCSAGELEGDIDTLIPVIEVPLDGAGDGFIITDVEEIPSNSYAAAQLAGSIAPASTCIVAGPDNDSWTRAEEIDLAGGIGEVSTGSSSGFIDNVGTSRWFKFSIIPGAKATIELSNLPADYDLAVFKDIAQAFSALAEGNDVDGLNRLGAEFAPSAFTPSAFTPSAFTPSSLSPSAFTPSAFTPSAFTPSLFAPSAFTPSAFTGSAFSPSAFTPSAFTPSAFTPSAFTQTDFNPSAFTPSAFTDDNFSSAQTRSLIAVSAQTGTGTERVLADTWNNTGDFYVRVSGKNGESNLDQAFSLAVELDGELCNGVVPEPFNYIATDGGYQSIILYDSSQMMADGYSFEQIAPLEDRLGQLADRSEVNGVVVDLGSIIPVQILHAQADEASSCPYAANLTAQAVKTVIDAYREAGNPLKYVVLAGSDGHIPFFRYPDQGLLGPEQDYDPPMANDTQSQASLRLNYVLGQDEYGAATTVSLNDGQFPIPDLAVGRLVETVPDMVRVLDAYLATPAGVVTPTSTLATGYDFLTDAADAIQTELVAGTNGNGRAAERNSTLITDSDVAPDDACTGAASRRCSWTSSQFRNELLNQGEDLIFLAGHFSANNTLAADYKTTATVLDLASSSVDLVNSLVFAAGCHSGYNIVNPDAVPGVTLQLDWPQAFAQKGATLVAGTGYQYGDTDFIEYSERLYLQFAKELRKGSEPVSVGEALARAKKLYLATTPDIRGLHRKSILISTVFGLPMLKIDLNRIPADADDSLIVPALVSSDPGAHLGLEEASLSLSYGSGELTERAVPLTVIGGGSITATYFSGPDGVVTNPGEPALPLESIDVSAPGLSLRGVGFQGGDWSEQPLVPLTGAPATEIRGVHTPFASLVNFPMRMATPNYYGPLSQSLGTILHVTPAQHRVANIGDTEATLRLFSNLDYRLFYSNNTQTYGANRPALAGPPTISSVSAVPVASAVEFTATVVGAPSAGIQSVWVTYTEGDADSGTWESLELSQDPADSRIWRGTLAGGVSGYSRLDYMVQAANGVGLVSKDDNYGAYYQLVGTGAPQKLVSVLQLSGPSGSALPAELPIGDTIPLEVQLSYQNGGLNLVNGAPIVFTLGTTTRVATTVGGYATVDLPLNATATGNSLLVASFAGNDLLLPASDQQSFNVTKGTTTLTLDFGAQTVGVESVNSAVTAKLTADDGDSDPANDVPLLNKWVYFTIYGGPDGLITKSAQTNNVGVAELGELRLPPQSYRLEVRYLGEIPIPDQVEPLILTNSDYEPAITRTTLNLIGGQNCPTADLNSKVELVNFCYLVHKVKGKVQITNGTLILGGSSEIVDEDGVVVYTTTGGIIDNKIDQIGAGSVVIHASAKVKGKIKETGDGGILVLGYAGNKLEEFGDGDVEVGLSGIVTSKIDESGAGSIIVKGSVGGGLQEEEDGDISIAAGASADGDAQESGSGSLVVSGTLNGNAQEEGSGDLVITVTGTVYGDAHESGAGSLFNDGVVTGNVEQK